MEPIPLREGPARYEESAFLPSEFVEIKSNSFCEVRMQYPLRNMKNAEEQCFVRKEVYELLQKAAQRLPAGYKFCIWDAWRPFMLQKELYEVYSGEIIRDFGLDSCTREEADAVIRKFVSDPVADVCVPPVNTTGGAIDLTLMDDTGRALPMGTGFDAFTEKTNTAWFEGKNDDRVRDNRRLLYHIMTSVGFTNLPSEWWHFDYGDRFWGYYNHKPAIYRGVFTKEEIYAERERESEKGKE